VEELDEIMENLDLGKPSGIIPNRKIDNIPIKDLTAQSGGVTDNHEDMWSPGLKLHNKEQAAPRWGTRKYTSSVHQVYTIISEVTEEDDGENIPVINSQNLEQGNSRRKEREKVYISAEEWRMLKSAVNHGTTIPVESKREVLMGYQYALHQHKKQLLQEKV
jgi:hypothetical protein